MSLAIYSTAVAVDPDVWVPHTRIALVIGNSHYGAPAGANALIWPDLEDGPLKDADAISTRLRALGFEVTELKDQNLDQMNADLRAFAQRIAAAPDGLAIFYFSGHGARAPHGSGDDGSSERRSLSSIAHNCRSLSMSSTTTSCWCLDLASGACHER